MTTQKETYRVSASVSCMDLMNLEQHMEQVQQTDIDFYHYDVVDGIFNRCFILGDLLLEKIKPYASIPIEVHLAVYEPERYLSRFADADYIAVHYEAMDHPLQIFDKIRSYGAQPILAYKASTVPGDDFIALAKECPWVLKLTVNPGFSGQTIQPAAIEHIRLMDHMIKEAGISTRIQADGNVNPSTITRLADAGATIFTGGSSGLFVKGHSIQENKDILLSSIER